MKACRGRSCLVLAVLLLAWPPSAEPQTPPVVRTTLDTMGAMGIYSSSIAIGSDGRGLVAYHDDVLGDLKVAHCSNHECTAATITTLDSVGDVGESTGLTIGADGLGLIAYYDRTNATVKIAHCSNLPCTAAAIRTLGPSGPSIAIITGSDGLGLISYSGSGLNVAHCLDAACSSATTTNHPGAGTIRSWMVGSDGLALGVGPASGPSIRALHCSNLDCSAATINPIATGQLNEFLDAFIVPGTNGLGYVSIPFSTFIPPMTGSRAGFCVDVVCSALTSVPVSYSGRLARGSDGFPLITGSLPIVRDCIDAGCSSVLSHRFDVAGAHGAPSLAVRADFRPLVSYWSFAQGALKVAHCANADCFMTGADLSASVGHNGGSGNVVPGQMLGLLAGVQNLGPEVAPEATLRFNVPSRLLVQQLTPGPPTCTLASGEVVCRFTDVPAGGGASASVQTLVDHGPAESLTFVATVTGSGLFDLDPTNEADTDIAFVMASCFMSDVAVVEGDAGNSDAVFAIRRWTSSQFDNFSYDTVDGTAVAGQDYVATSGVLSFAVGQSEAEVRVPIVGDTAVESDERFHLQIGFPQTCALMEPFASGTILDDDAASLSTRELSHGSSGWYAASPPTRGVPPLTDLYRMRQEPFASYEVVLDGASGDMTPIAIERIAADNSTVLQTALSFGTSASLRWMSSTGGTVDNQHLHVVGGGCAGGCGPDDVYRIRAYETTASIPRFNNAGGQVSVLVLQNTTPDTVAGQVRFWTPAGTILATRAINLAPMSTLVLNTTTVPALPGASGSVTITHDGRYGALAGKMISLEHATGFSFDSPLAYRPR